MDSCSAKIDDGPPLPQPRASEPRVPPAAEPVPPAAEPFLLQGGTRLPRHPLLLVPKKTVPRTRAERVIVGHERVADYRDCFSRKDRTGSTKKGRSILGFALEDRSDAAQPSGGPTGGKKVLVDKNPTGAARKEVLVDKNPTGAARKEVLDTKIRENYDRSYCSAPASLVARCSGGGDMEKSRGCNTFPLTVLAGRRGTHRNYYEPVLGQAQALLRVC